MRLEFTRQIVTALLAVFTSGLAQGAEDYSVQQSLEALRVKHGVPALAAAAIVNGVIVDAGAVGFRRTGDETRVTVNDRWHIGSCTKSMTAVLAAMLVDGGRLRWDITVGEVFPELRDKMNGKWANVTLEQLLTHRSGAPGSPPAPLWMMAWQQAGTPREQRLSFTYGLLQLPHEAPAGTKFIYSNQGYAIAGAMLERTMDRPWEEMIKERIFAPLGMTASGFGSPGSASVVDQPRGHVGKTNALQPVEPGPASDNPPAIGPAGTVHCSISDLARYAGWHAAKRIGPGELLHASGTWEKLHLPVGEEAYAMGWGVAERPWAKGKALSHSGSNTMWYAVMWGAPGRNAAFVAAANAGTQDAAKACDEAVSALIQQHLRDGVQ